MSTSKRSQFRVQRSSFGSSRLHRPSLTDEQDRLWRMVEKTGSPQGAAQDLFSRLAALEEQVAEWEQAALTEEPSPAANEPAPSSEQKPETD